jgi:hypothetical protein
MPNMYKILPIFNYKKSRKQFSQTAHCSLTATTIRPSKTVRLFM